jgi:hypothetical protein
VLGGGGGGGINVRGGGGLRPPRPPPSAADLAPRLEVAARATPAAQPAPRLRWPWVVALGVVVVAAATGTVVFLSRDPASPAAGGATHGTYNPFGR